MNYPIWELPAAGLLIAFVAIVHVFISHFAVGGGLFLVVLERRARRTHDAALLAYTRRHSRFFVLVTLVAGVVTGVGIWFTIGLVHPSATSSLIQLFVWFWAIEWTFFATEIAAALVYFYGWDRLDARTHLAVGWVYVCSAWMSLVVINGILTFMLTPGAWPVTGDIWDAFFNPTYWPALVTRTLAAVGLAGLYALLTASWMADGDVKPRLTRVRRGVGPAHGGGHSPVVAVVPRRRGGRGGGRGRHVGRDRTGRDRRPARGGVRQRQRLPAGPRGGARLPGGRTRAHVVDGAGRVATGANLRADHRGAHDALWAAHVRRRRVRARRPAKALRHRAGDVRQRAPAADPVGGVDGSGRPGPLNDDAFTVERVNAAGVLGTAKYVAPDPKALASSDGLAQQEARGRAVFRLLCSVCHTVDGHIAIRAARRGTPRRHTRTRHRETGGPRGCRRPAPAVVVPWSERAHVAGTPHAAVRRNRTGEARPGRLPGATRGLDARRVATTGRGRRGHAPVRRELRDVPRRRRAVADAAQGQPSAGRVLRPPWTAAAGQRHDGPVPRAPTSSGGPWPPTWPELPSKETR